MPEEGVVVALVDRRPRALVAVASRVRKHRKAVVATVALVQRVAVAQVGPAAQVELAVPELDARRAPEELGVNLELRAL